MSKKMREYEYEQHEVKGQLVELSVYTVHRNNRKELNV